MACNCCWSWAFVSFVVRQTGCSRLRVAIGLKLEFLKLHGPWLLQNPSVEPSHIEQENECDYALHATDETGRWLARTYEIKERHGHFAAECGACGRWPSNMTLPNM